jgi:glucosamine-6-phosphate deaminase
LNLIVVEDYESLSKVGAEKVLETIQTKPNATICLPTGNTPLGMYKELSFITNDLSLWKNVKVVCLDEYARVGPGEEKSLYRWLTDAVIDPLGIEKKLCVDSLSEDLPEACEGFDQYLSKIGGLDLTVLGLGLNGHIGFNEPMSPPDSRTRVVELTVESLQSNSKYWGIEPSRVPAHGITLGIGTILESQSIILLVSGHKKAEVLKRLVEEEENERLPASFLKRSSHLTIIADQEAAAYLGNIE